MYEDYPRCGCRQWCGDLPEANDDPDATCKGLARGPQSRVEIVVVPRSPSHLPEEGDHA